MNELEPVTDFDWEAEQKKAGRRTEYPKFPFDPRDVGPLDFDEDDAGYNGPTAAVILDSVNAAGVRLTTMEVKFWRPMLAEFNTHRVFSRNSASSRAIPVKKQLAKVVSEPAMPLEYRYNQPGMQPAEPLSPADQRAAEHLILALRDKAVETAEALSQLGPINPETGEPLGLHKQWTNRYIEPWMWHKVIVTSTEWDNFFHQRSTSFSPLGQADIRFPADMMLKAYRAAYEQSVPQELYFGQWHTPYISAEEFDQLNPFDRIRISVARCARVSYLTHDGVRDLSEDINLFNKLTSATPMHASPFEHIGTPYPGADATPKTEGDLLRAMAKSGNFHYTWEQLRHSDTLKELL